MRRTGYGYTGLWLLPDVAGGATYVRVDCTTTRPPAAPLGMFAYEVAGLGDEPQLDPAGGVSSTAGASTGTATTVSSGPCPAITQSQEIIFGFGHIYDVTLNAPSGAWTTMIGGGVQNFWSGYQIAAVRAVPTLDADREKHRFLGICRRRDLPAACVVVIRQCRTACGGKAAHAGPGKNKRPAQSYEEQTSSSEL